MMLQGYFCGLASWQVCIAANLKNVALQQRTRALPAFGPE